MKNYQVLNLYYNAQDDVDLDSIKIYGKELRMRGFTRSDVEKLRPFVKLYIAVIQSSASDLLLISNEWINKIDKYND